MKAKLSFLRLSLLGMLSGVWMVPPGAVSYERGTPILDAEREEIPIDQSRGEGQALILCLSLLGMLSGVWMVPAPTPSGGDARYSQGPETFQSKREEIRSEQR